MIHTSILKKIWSVIINVLSYFKIIKKVKSNKPKKITNEWYSQDLAKMKENLLHYFKISKNNVVFRQQLFIKSKLHKSK